MDEEVLIDRYFRSRVPPRADVVLGIGDDGAVLRPETGFDLVIATDTLVAGTHFPPDCPAASIGHRALAVNLSDLAAMGAEPHWFTLALSLPDAGPDWLEAFAGGLLALARRAGAALVGGDTVRGPLAATVTALGRVRPGGWVGRSGARPGDGVWLTGSTGEAAAGLALLGAGDVTPAADRLRQRFLYPEPRISLGPALVTLASAMIDVSDGLQTDLGRLVAASGVGAELDLEAVPLSPALRSVRPQDALALALHGGDDYELCVTVPPAREPALEGLAATAPVRLTRLGHIVEGQGLRWRRHGRDESVPGEPFRHFG